MNLYFFLASFSPSSFFYIPQKGRPDLLAEIRKSNHQENAEKQDVDGLRAEIKSLKTRMTNMNREMEKMASLVANLMQNQHLQSKGQVSSTMDLPPAPPALVSNKKRKVCSSPLPSAVSSTPSGGITGGIDLEALDDISVDLDMFVPPPKVAPSPIVPNSRQTSAASFNSTDEEILSSLFALDSSDDLDVVRQKSIANEPSLQNYRFPETSTESGTGSSSGEQGPDPILMTKLRNALSVLPKNLQQMFVDRIVAFVVDPESFKKQVDAISNLAVTAASEARNRMGEAAADNSAQTNALASAVLGAWLSRYGSSSTTTVALLGGGDSNGTNTIGASNANDSIMMNNESMAMTQEVLSACDPLQYHQQQRPPTPDPLLMAPFPVI